MRRKQLRSSCAQKDDANAAQKITANKLKFYAIFKLNSPDL